MILLAGGTPALPGPAMPAKKLAENAGFRQSIQMVRLVLFDVDGTLVHTGRAGSQAFAKTFATAFNAHDGIEKIKFAGRTDVSLVREFFSHHRIPATPENFERFFTRFVFWLDHIVAQSHGEICRGVTEFLDDLCALPHPPALGLLTGNIQLGAEIKLRRYGLWERFSFGGFADDHEDRNHIAAAALQRGRRVLGRDLRPEEIVVVGDTPYDIRCGKFIGARVLAVATGGAKLDALKRHSPDWAVEDLTRVNAREICL
jgi:phosphoglycolate phosphatase-like HAD superfamily hydrolase